MSKKRRKSTREVYAETYRLLRLEQHHPGMRHLWDLCKYDEAACSFVMRDEAFLGWRSLHQAAYFEELRKQRFPALTGFHFPVSETDDYIPF